ncbi:2-keto-4-pentenoate hydratase/2-oxohepta-3-ene-1,7-dioic acid hydratase (catechol pathway) [Fulvimarina manganoxydans]|uniref:2-keto-4-pentenoate hydratase/2-oxohepta-3-ene-1,7-dioic acid hydratase (Catechol pathway) n=1 Tax=Fulvimarina manganoxydans TaxID=937218 RepID=A0A1W1YI90_9HYPH|nr:fumarylacetoacetate hydrolase family protein [Fulvimarina manganoxydans]SMC35521.1 2-keto-4-pentenoate hydratase/2-oxohepta-3-ene-1,7-dioic acid hydratase (catechol pathway) [Fulvimarina manganoxydans]
MRFVRFGARGAEKPGLIDEGGTIRDLSGSVDDLSGHALDPARLDALSRLDVTTLPAIPADVRLCKPVGRIGKIVGVGPNFPVAASLAGFKVNPEPTLFLKASTAACGPNDPIEIPRLATRVDWGVEIAVVIGRMAKSIEIEGASSVIAGYCLANDLSERNHQLQRGGQWTKGKSHDTFCPLGPWLVTPDEVGDPGSIDLFLEVNGIRQQEGAAADMIFKIPYLVSYVSRFMRLEPGDVILSGTIGGVGLSYDPPRFLKAGDRLRVGGTKLGEQEMMCRDE